MPIDLLIAKHEAAHAIVAWRLNVPVRRLSVEALERDGHALDGHTICDWESLRFRTSDDNSLFRAAFAIAYSGIALEMQVADTPFAEVYERLPTDRQAATYVRTRLREWTGVPETDRAAAISSSGYNLAHSIVSQEMSRINRLAQELIKRRTLDEVAMNDWFSRDIGMFDVTSIIESSRGD